MKTPGAPSGAAINTWQSTAMAANANPTFFLKSVIMQPIAITKLKKKAILLVSSVCFAVIIIKNISPFSSDRITKITVEIMFIIVCVYS